MSGDGAERPAAGAPEHDAEAPLPRPEIDPALLDRLAGAPGRAPGGDALPWDIAAQALVEVPDVVEGSPETETRAEGAPDESADDDAAIALAEVALGSEELPADEVAAPPGGNDTPEELAALLAVPLAQRIEALLFAATEPLPIPKLRALAAADDPLELRRTLDTLGRDYDAANRAFTLVEVGGGFVLRTRPELSSVVARLGRRRETEKLSTAALETLAIVAYRQPVLRADVEKIRGVASGEVIRTLVERGLVRVAGRAEVPGNPLLYGTTQRFLELFGLRNLRDLPSDESLLRG